MVYLGNSHALHVDVVECKGDAAVSAPQRKSVTSNHFDHPALRHDLPSISANNRGSASPALDNCGAVVQEQRNLTTRMVCGAVGAVPVEARRPRKNTYVPADGTVK